MISPIQQFLYGVSLGMLIAFVIGYWGTITAIPHRIVEFMLGMNRYNPVETTTKPLEFHKTTTENYTIERASKRELFFRLYVKNNMSGILAGCHVKLCSVNGVPHSADVLTDAQPSSIFSLRGFERRKFEVFNVPLEGDRNYRLAPSKTSASLRCFDNGAVTTLKFALKTPQQFLLEFSAIDRVPVALMLKLFIDGSGKCRLEEIISSANP